MGRVLVHLAMLSTASGWDMPLDPAPDITDEVPPITDGVDGARDRRRLVATNCNGWCVCPPRSYFPPVRNLAAAALSAAILQRLPHRPVIIATIMAATIGAATASLGSSIATGMAATGMAATTTATSTMRLPTATRTATPAVAAALLASTAPQARHSWPACLCGAAKQPSPAHGAVAPAITHHSTVHARARRFEREGLRL